MTETRLALLGPLRISMRDQSFVFTSAPIAALLGYLALYATQGRVVTRSSLANTLWPDLKEIYARRRLSETLYRLRQTSPAVAACLQINKEILALRSLSIDIDEFYRCTASPDLSDWRRALELYTGDLLENIDADWLTSDRIWFRDQYLATLARTCTALAEAGEFAEALTYAHRWTLVDSLNEDAHRAVMRLNVRLGRHAVALQQYDSLVHLLEEELQATPLPETRTLANAIRSEYHDSSNYPTTVPTLVGRNHERAHILKLLEQAQEGHGGIVLLEGELGIGKTRLMESIAESASWRGIRAIWGKSSLQTMTTPYAPLTTVLEKALSGPRVDQVRTYLPEPIVYLLSTLVPRLALDPSDMLTREHPGSAKRLVQEMDLQDINNSLNVTKALTKTFSTLAEITPHLVLLDDVQWASVQFWTMLRVWVPLLSRQRLLIIMSYNSNELRANKTAWHTLCSLDRDQEIPHILLKGLTPDSCTDLVRTFGITLNQDRVLALHQETAGNPMLMREVLSSPSNENASIALHNLFDQRLVRLAPSAQVALQAATVLGQIFTYRQWHALSGSSLLTAIPALIAERFLEETDQGYCFPQNLLREHVYNAIPRQRRLCLHRRAAESLLLDQTGPDTIAWHFTQAEAWAEALRWYREAGDQAMRAEAYVRAAEHYEEALALLTHLPQSADEQSALLTMLQQALSANTQKQSIVQPPPLVVRLARADAPLGKTLTDAERVTARWTIDAGPADAMILRTDGKVALRRHRIVRLIEEALAQGAVPTTLDVARALGVTERTIVADIAAIRMSGKIVITRRYKTK